MTRATPIPKAVTIHVPFRVVTRGGRKEMMMPDCAVPSGRTDSMVLPLFHRTLRRLRFELR